MACLLTPWSRVLPDKLTGFQLVRNSHFMVPEGSLPHSQVPATCSLLSQIDSVHALTYHFLKIHLNIILPSTPGSFKRFLPSGFPTRTLYTPLLSPHTCYVTRPSHSSRLDRSKNWGEKYRSLSFSYGVAHETEKKAVEKLAGGF